MMHTVHIDGHDVIVDDEGLSLLSTRAWRVRNCGKKLYVRASANIDGKKVHLFLHRLLANTPADLCTDHINGNSLDNRVCNLRVVTKAENNQNLSKPKVDNKCGLLGANWHKATGKWRAQIRLNRKTIHIGYFATAQQAHDAYIKRKREIHRVCTV